MPNSESVNDIKTNPKKFISRDKRVCYSGDLDLYILTTNLRKTLK